jgi:alkylated DNA repair dioxygenase AlkB
MQVDNEELRIDERETSVPTEERITPIGLRLQHYALKDGGIVDYYPGFLSKKEADELWEICKYDATKSKEEMVVPWKQDMIVVGGRKVLEPRFTAFLGSKSGLEYTYSGKVNISAKWPSPVETAKERIEKEVVQHPLNVVLMNWYTSGNHHVSWHADNEEDLVDGAAIASLSLGETRCFQLRHRSESVLGQLQTELGTKMKQQGVSLTEKEKEMMKKEVGKDIELNKEIQVRHGDLLIMRGTLQKNWRHRVPMVKNQELGPRICFTFRRVMKDDL